tara:strand:- start:222 stop:884 length:663 start_codon:yes stop_codon:yes gene_type:complete
MSINLRNPSNKDKLELLKKDMDLESLLSVYPEEALNNLTNNKQKLAKLSKMFNNVVATVSKSVMIMKCDTAKCPFKNVCELRKMDLAPHGYPCPVEKKISMEMESNMVSDLDIDTQDTVEMELLYDFIDAKLLDMRTSSMIADGNLVQTVKSICEGQLIPTSRDIAPEFKVKVELKKMKAALLEEFMATRKAKKRYGIGSSTNDIQKMLNERMNEIKNKG